MAEKVKKPLAVVKRLPLKRSASSASHASLIASAHLGELALGIIKPARHRNVCAGGMISANLVEARRQRGHRRDASCGVFSEIARQNRVEAIEEAQSEINVK